MTEVPPTEPIEEDIDDDLDMKISEELAILGRDAPDYKDIPDAQGDDGAAFLEHTASGVDHHGLNPTERIRARRLIKFAALETMRHKSGIHYTMGNQRWQGINRQLRCYPGKKQYPTQADCSAMATWLYWNALKREINQEDLPDIVNSAHWKAGYTGTMLNNGRRISSGVPSQVGDLVIYRGHVATYIGNGNVHSHGSEAGPFILPWRYRRDIVSVRRYL
jgi:hypothetical protein